MYYYRIDFIDDEKPKDGFSVCVASTEEIGEDNVLDAAIRANVIDKWDTKSFCVNIEDITTDEYELSFWKQEAVSLD